MRMMGGYQLSAVKALVTLFENGEDCTVQSFTEYICKPLQFAMLWVAHKEKLDSMLNSVPLWTKLKQRLAGEPDTRGCLLPHMARGSLDAMLEWQVVEAELQQLKNGVVAEAQQASEVAGSAAAPQQPSSGSAGGGPAADPADDPETKMRSEHDAFEQRAKLNAEFELDRLITHP